MNIELTNIPMYTKTSLKSELNGQGWRLTSQRQKILEIFQNLTQGNHLSTEDLYRILRQEGQDISLSTIYRTLKLMASLGVLRKLDLAQGHKYYELNKPYPHHHAHLICLLYN
jgi:Fur family ferric uptake transcriptional regulator